jgi:superfamily I DNA/RNA helicase
MQWINFSQSASQRSKDSVLDQEQIKTKNFAIQGHALIRGVAGSGKSLILRDRIHQVLEQGFDRVLVLSYNRYMNHYLNDGLEKSNSKVECKTFHSWAYRPFDYSYKDDNNTNARKLLIEAAKKSKLKYQAILIDEAQDFYDEWFQALVEVLDPTTNSLFFVYDNAQSVYGESHRRKSTWTWKNLGIDVKGRSSILDVNYRNSPEILEFSWKFIKSSVEENGMEIANKKSSPTIDKIIEPVKKSSRSSEVTPLLIQINYELMSEEIARQVQMAKEQDQDARIGILIHPKVVNSSQNTLQSDIAHHLNSLGIQAIAPLNSQERQDNIFQSGSVVVDSWNALKGLEFDAVIIAGVDYAVASENQDEDFKEKAGLYVAMTRAKDHLVMLYEEHTPIIEQLKDALIAPNCLDTTE